MKRRLKATAASVFVTYANGDYSNNLTGKNFEVDESEGCLSIDMSGNLRVRNKGGNDYADACELAENRADVKSVQICDGQVIERLRRRFQDGFKMEQLQLILEGKGTFKYAVVGIRKSNGSVFVDVQAAT